MTSAAKTTDARDGLLRRIATTPMRDVIRGRLTARLDIDRIVADLPPTIADLVRRVTKRTGLRRLERAAVAEELAAHFRDGLHAGAEPLTLIESFGDAEQTARLIRRAVKRNRPLPWRVLVRGLQGVALVVAVAALFYGYLAARFFLASPPPPLDYRPILNAEATAIPADERAWPMYRDAIIDLGLPLEDEALAQYDATPGDDGWEAWQIYLLDHQAALAQVRAAAAMPGLGLTVGHGVNEADQAVWTFAEMAGSAAAVEEQGLVQLRLPHLMPLRELVMLLTQDAHLAAETGNGARAVADVRAALGIAQHVREVAVFISDLVAAAAVARAADVTGDLLQRAPHAFTDDELQALAHAFAALDDDALRVRLNSERLFFEDIMRRAYTEDGSGDGFLTAEGLRMLDELIQDADEGIGEPAELTPIERITGPGMSFVSASKAEVLDLHDELMSLAEAEAARPLWQRGDDELDFRVATLAASPLDRVRYGPIVMLMPAIGRASVNVELALQRRDAVTTAVALELFRRERGRWPDTLTELVPALLPAVPPDRFTGRPAGYIVRNGRPVLYAVGTDHDDDGGTPVMTAAGEPRPDDASRWVSPQRASSASPDDPSIPDGDWILWHGPVVEHR